MWCRSISLIPLYHFLSHVPPPSEQYLHNAIWSLSHFFAYSLLKANSHHTSWTVQWGPCCKGCLAPLRNSFYLQCLSMANTNTVGGGIYFLLLTSRSVTGHVDSNTIRCCGLPLRGGPAANARRRHWRDHSYQKRRAFGLDGLWHIPTGVLWAGPKWGITFWLLANTNIIEPNWSIFMFSLP